MTSKLGIWSAAAMSVAATACLSCGQPAFGQDEADTRLGNVHFATSCNETAQRRFDRAMRYQHSFWYRESKEIFEEAVKADPECGIAYWGIALSLLNNPHNPPPAPNLPLGLAAIQKAKAVGAKTERERDFIDALSVFYTDYDKVPHGARVQLYLKAMEGVAQRNPADDEAQLFYAITLNVGASPSDKTYSNQLKGAAILEQIFKRQPRHPGVAHYLIHLYNSPALAEKGIDAAKRYAEIAPAAPHAQHMPSHIFTRVGYWNKSIGSNIASARAAKDGKDFGEQLHAIGLPGLCLSAARPGRQSAQGHRRHEYGHRCQPRRAARQLFARGVAGALHGGTRRLEGCGGPAGPGNEVPQVQALTHFARALGAARSGNPDAAKADIAKLAELRDKLREAKDAYWAEQVDIQRQVATAFLLEAEGKHDDALKALSAAADAEDKTEKSPVTPGMPKPARELYGIMLLERGMAREALAAFEATIKKEPNRFNAIAGAAKAAERLGDQAKAKDYYQKLTTLAGNADTVRPDLAAARAFLAKN